MANQSSFYNGHLSETLRRLNDLDTPDKANKAAAVRYPKPQTHLHEIPQSPSQTKSGDMNAAYLSQLREDLAFELASPLGHVSYPENLTFSNYVDFIFCPTLCYEIEYPRTPKVRPLEVFYKTLAVFGCIFLMVITAEEFILPVLDESAIRLHRSNSSIDFSLIMAETVGRLLFPFMITFLLVFLVIFEYILGAFAEITRKSQRRPRQTVLVLTLSQVLRIANSMQTGGTAATGSSSLASGTSLSIISSVDMSTRLLRITCRALLPQPSPLLSLPWRMSW